MTELYLDIRLLPESPEGPFVPEDASQGGAGTHSGSFPCLRLRDPCSRFRDSCSRFLSPRSPFLRPRSRLLSLGSSFLDGISDELAIFWGKVVLLFFIVCWMFWHHSDGAKPRNHNNPTTKKACSQFQGRVLRFLFPH